MSVSTDWRTSRREDKLAEAAIAREDKAQAAADARELKLLELQAQRQEAEDKRKDADARAARELAERKAAQEADEKAKKLLRAERARAKKEKRERRKAFVRSIPGWVSENLDLAATIAVMGCSIIPALISQATTLQRMGLEIILVLMIPVMLECASWASNAAEEKALKQGRAAWPYRIAGWLFAGFAASVNYHTGLQVGGHGNNTSAAAILAATSIVPLALYQLIQLGRHREAKAKQREARKQRRQVRKDREARAERYPSVWQAALNLQAVAGSQRLSLEDAWHAAWAVFEGRVSFRRRCWRC